MKEQLRIFGNPGQSENLPLELLTYFPELFDTRESGALLTQLIKETQWEEHPVSMYGKNVQMPRLTAWYGDPEKTYSFSGNRFLPRTWTSTLLSVRERVEPLAGVVFNSVLLNYYRDMNDSVSWHSDSETELGTQPIIASVSFGQTRTFDIRRKSDHEQKYSIQLEDGSLLLMKGDLQEHWEHRIPKATVPMKPRINLTFRIIN